MISSIRRFLLFYLLLSITVVSSLAVISNYYLFKRDMKRHFDDHLSRMAEYVATLYIPTTKTFCYDKTTQNMLKIKMYPYVAAKNDYSIKIWDRSKKILFATHNLHKIKYAKLKFGFHHTVINNQYWEFYTKKFYPYEFIVQVGEVYYPQKTLSQNIIRHYIQVLLITCFGMGILIWLIVGYGLRKLNSLADILSQRSAVDLDEINASDFPIEIKPIVDGLNNLFLRLQKAFNRNKRFAADAAHELRTPLAALKTQCQVAILAPTTEEKKRNIQKVIQGANRCTHVVQQLLTLSRLSEEASLDDMKSIDLTHITTDMLAQLAPLALEKNIDISFNNPNQHVKIYGNDTAISILIRNLVDNAIRYTPENGIITVEIISNEQNVILKVVDSGSGIPPELHSQVFERFYRVLGTKTSGSGLGLPIVKQIAELHNATIQLSDPPHGTGLQVEIFFKTNKNLGLIKLNKL